MKKFLTVLILVFAVFLGGCDRERPAIFFSSHPIDKNTFNPDQVSNKNFWVGQKIYFLVYYPKGFPTNSIRLQVITKKDDVKFYGIDIVQVRDVHVKQGSMIYRGSFCLYKNSLHYLRVFSPDDWYVPLVQDWFWVRES